MSTGADTPCLDSGDWAIGTNPQYTHESVLAEMTGWFEGSKSPGINSLEHEIKDTEVDAFIAAFPVGRSNGWDIRSIPDAFGQRWYVNSDSNSAPVVSRSVAEGAFTGSEASTSFSPGGSSSSSSSSSSASASASSTSGSMTSTSSGSSTMTSSQSQASSGAANAPTASPSNSNSNGAGRVVGVSAGSLWVLLGIITAWVL